MEFSPPSLGIGIAIGWFVNWSYDQWHEWSLARKQRRGAYYSVDYSGDYIEFRGHAKKRIAVKKMLKKLFEHIDSDTN